MREPSRHPDQHLTVQGPKHRRYSWFSWFSACRQESPATATPGTTPRTAQPQAIGRIGRIALGAVVVLGIGATTWTVLPWRYGGVGHDVELDAVRTAGALMAGTGGALDLC
jgi:hypothetical protein